MDDYDADFDGSSSQDLGGYQYRSDFEISAGTGTLDGKNSNRDMPAKNDRVLGSSANNNLIARSQNSVKGPVSEFAPRQQENENGYGQYDEDFDDIPSGEKVVAKEQMSSLDAPNAAYTSSTDNMYGDDDFETGSTTQSASQIYQSRPGGNSGITPQGDLRNSPAQHNKSQTRLTESNHLNKSATRLENQFEAPQRDAQQYQSESKLSKSHSQLAKSRRSVNFADDPKPESRQQSQQQINVSHSVKQPKSSLQNSQSRLSDSEHGPSGLNTRESQPRVDNSRVGSQRDVHGSQSASRQVLPQSQYSEDFSETETDVPSRQRSHQQLDDRHKSTERLREAQNSTDFADKNHPQSIRGSQRGLSDNLGFADAPTSTQQRQMSQQDLNRQSNSRQQLQDPHGNVNAANRQTDEQYLNNTRSSREQLDEARYSADFSDEPSRQASHQQLATSSRNLANGTTNPQSTRVSQQQLSARQLSNSDLVSTRNSTNDNLAKRQLSQQQLQGSQNGTIFVQGSMDTASRQISQQQLGGSPAHWEQTSDAQHSAQDSDEASGALSQQGSHLEMNSTHASRGQLSEDRYSGDFSDAANEPNSRQLSNQEFGNENYANYSTEFDEPERALSRQQLGSAENMNGPTYSADFLSDFGSQQHMSNTHTSGARMSDAQNGAYRSQVADDDYSTEHGHIRSRQASAQHLYESEATEPINAARERPEPHLERVLYSSDFGEEDEKQLQAEEAREKQSYMGDVQSSAVFNEDAQNRQTAAQSSKYSNDEPRDMHYSADFDDQKVSQHPSREIYSYSADFGSEYSDAEADAHHESALDASDMDLGPPPRGILSMYASQLMHSTIDKAEEEVNEEEHETRGRQERPAVHYVENVQGHPAGRQPTSVKGSRRDLRETNPYVAPERAFSGPLSEPVLPLKQNQAALRRSKPSLPDISRSPSRDAREAAPHTAGAAPGPKLRGVKKSLPPLPAKTKTAQRAHAAPATAAEPPRATPARKPHRRPRPQKVVAAQEPPPPAVSPKPQRAPIIIRPVSAHSHHPDPRNPRSVAYHLQQQHTHELLTNPELQHHAPRTIDYPTLVSKLKHQLAALKEQTGERSGSINQPILSHKEPKVGACMWFVVRASVHLLTYFAYAGGYCG
ncbi:hypothetical protein DFS34DRAFT_214134 [Phlyctochytrium arcticum]|nr:hypothetical protein DFS34DRAFT_214134 [Phlyctochytrium arcticum]